MTYAALKRATAPVHSDITVPFCTNAKFGESKARPVDAAAKPIEGTLVEPAFSVPFPASKVAKVNFPVVSPAVPLPIAKEAAPRREMPESLVPVLLVLLDPHPYTAVLMAYVLPPLIRKVVFDPFSMFTVPKAFINN
jgi:hypothetical protein